MILENHFLIKIGHFKTVKFRTWICLPCILHLNMVKKNCQNINLFAFILFRLNL